MDPKGQKLNPDILPQKFTEHNPNIKSIIKKCAGTMRKQAKKENFTVKNYCGDSYTHDKVRRRK